MAKGLFITRDEAWLNETLAAALANVNAGSVVVSWSDSGTSVSRSITMDAETVIDECNWALRRKFPQTYGARNRHLASDLSQQDFN